MQLHYPSDETQRVNIYAQQLKTEIITCFSGSSIDWSAFLDYLSIKSVENSEKWI